VLRVETHAAVRHAVELAEDRIGQHLADQAIRYESVRVAGEDAVEVRGADPDRGADVRRALDEFGGGDWDVSALARDAWRVSMPSALRSALEARAVQTTLNVIRERVDGFGVAEPVVQQQGTDRILIQLPGVEDPQRVKDLLVAQEMLQWKEVSYPPAVTDYSGYFPPDTREAVLAQFGGTLPDDTELVAQEVTTERGEKFTVYWPLKKVSVVIGDDLKDAWRGQDEWGSPAVHFELEQDAGRRFEAATRKAVSIPTNKRKMAIVLGSVTDNRVISAPTIEDVIQESGRILGQFTIEEAEDLALKLRSGAIPTAVEIIEERVVGPSLGRDSIRAGMIAGGAGFVAVMAFMLIYYRVSGVNAVVALGLNVLLVLGALGALPVLFPGVQATLTLPGIAGLILTVGMAVDSNVLILERIREELRLGKTVRSAVERGFSRAFGTIVDCNVTTLVAAFFLFSYGTGPVQGFAVTLFIGLLCSMFTAVFVSRQLFEIVLGRRSRAETLSI
jgi:preprotein translocase subunit SecD